MYISYQVLVGSARTMYECCVEGMNFEEFFEGEVAQYYCWHDVCYFVPLQQNLSAARFVQWLEKHQSAVQKASGSKSCQTNTPGPK